jgi:TonB family protein
MKTKRNYKKMADINIFMFLPVIALILIVCFSCGKTKVQDGTLEVSLSTTPVSTDMVYVEVDELPVFTGGDAALLKFVAENVTYPEEAKKNNITGKVVVKFVVGKDCSVSDVTILKSVSPTLDAEAVRVVKTLKGFEKPAIKNGVPVAVYYMVPIKFVLN